MAEGLFDPATMAIPHLPAADLRAAMVRVLPSTLLRLEVFDDAAAAAKHARNEVLPDGTELWHRAFTAADMARCDDPTFALGMVNHEFCQLVRQGAEFPKTVKLVAPGTGFAVSPHGHVLTNYHLAGAEIEFHRREAGDTESEVRCAHLRVQVATPAAGGWEWQDADRVFLVANPPAARAFRQDAAGRWHLNEDTALLRVEPSPSSFLRLSTRRAQPGDTVWMAGFPLRSARGEDARRTVGYDDADGSLRISAGRVTGDEGADCFVSDLDGSMGNSGSPVFDADGAVVGLFSRAGGDGPRNVIEFGHVSRVHVRTDCAVAGLDLSRLLAR